MWLFVLEVGGGDASYVWEVEYYGLVVSIFRGVGGDLYLYFRVVCGCIWLSRQPMIY